MTERIQKQAKEMGGQLSYPPSVLYAGESSRRMEFVRRAFNRSAVSNFGVGIEPTVDTTGVMRYKLDIGLSKTAEGFEGAVIAADTQTMIPEVVEGGVILTSKGKPKNQRELHQNLSNIQRTSEVTGENPFYQVESSSGLLHVNSAHVQIEDKHTCMVELNKPGVARLITEDGFAEYLKVFAAFYSGPPYSTNNMPPLSPADLSSGLSLPVLLQMGIVESVQGIHKTDNAFREVLRHNIHIVAVGISPAILEAVQVDSQKAIYEWGWLNQVVDHALEPQHP